MTSNERVPVRTMSSPDLLWQPWYMGLRRAMEAVLTGDSMTGVEAVEAGFRAYASDDGDIIWDVDTAQKYDAVNGVPANGGSLDGPGPVVVGGMVFVNSGYAFVGGMPGNVLLAFSIDGK